MYNRHSLLDMHARGHESLRRLIVFCGSLTADELRRPLPGFGFPTILGQFEHTIGAEVYWQTVVMRGYTEEATLPKLPDVAAIEAFRQQTASRDPLVSRSRQRGRIEFAARDDQRSGPDAAAPAGGCDHACRDPHLQPSGTGTRDVPHDRKTERHARSGLPGGLTDHDVWARETRIDDNRLIMHDDVDLSIQQFAQAWRLMCGGAPGKSLARAESVEYVFSGCPIPFFNIALLTARGISAADLKARAREACAWASDKGVPWLLLLTQEGLGPDLDAAALLDDCGLTPLMPLTGMLTERVTPSAQPSSGVELSVPQDDADVRRSWTSMRPRTEWISVRRRT
jgi:hypothetical protein